MRALRSVRAATTHARSAPHRTIDRSVGRRTPVVGCLVSFLPRILKNLLNLLPCVRFCVGLLVAAPAFDDPDYVPDALFFEKPNSAAVRFVLTPPVCIIVYVRA